jgi:hypothetical protein
MVDIGQKSWSDETVPFSGKFPDIFFRAEKPGGGQDMGLHPALGGPAVQAPGQTPRHRVARLSGIGIGNYLLVST